MKNIVLCRFVYLSRFDQVSLSLFLRRRVTDVFRISRIVANSLGLDALWHASSLFLPLARGGGLDLKLHRCLRILAPCSFPEVRRRAPLSSLAQPRPDCESSSSAFLPERRGASPRVASRRVAAPADSGFVTFNLDPIVRPAEGNFSNLRAGSGVREGSRCDDWI